MQFFNRKKDDSRSMPKDLPSLSSLDQIPMLPEPPKPVEQPKMMRDEKPTVAPLFVKIERYRQILSTIGSLKTSLIVVKNSLDTLDQIEKARDQTYSIVSDIVRRMDEKLINLDNELLRPAGFHSPSDTSAEQQDIRSIDATVSELRGQIEQLRSELGKMV
ncbi:MAG: hypothetical protein HYW22_02345 [Candidatus Aenigmarchaeota archaeon]|nr:hypothetical protein [Candidatus Aenigmarchaeota archaeon]